MIKHSVDDDPIVDELLAALPKPFLKRLQPETAATALADGLTRRSPRVMAPAIWKPISALRGIVAPALDPRLARNPRTQAALAELDTRPPHRDQYARSHQKARHDHLERRPNPHYQRRRRHVRLPRTRHRFRHSGGFPAPPDRSPRRLGPACRRRHRCPPSR